LMDLSWVKTCDLVEGLSHLVGLVLIAIEGSCCCADMVVRSKKVFPLSFKPECAPSGLCKYLFILCGESYRYFELVTCMCSTDTWY